MLEASKEERRAFGEIYKKFLKSGEFAVAPLRPVYDWEVVVGELTRREKALYSVKKMSIWSKAKNKEECRKLCNIISIAIHCWVLVEQKRFESCFISLCEGYKVAKVDRRLFLKKVKEIAMNENFVLAPNVSVEEDVETVIGKLTRREKAFFTFAKYADIDDELDLKWMAREFLEKAVKKRLKQPATFFMQIRSGYLIVLVDEKLAKKKLARTKSNLKKKKKELERAKLKYQEGEPQLGKAKENYRLAAAKVKNRLKRVEY